MIQYTNPNVITLHHLKKICIVVDLPKHKKNARAFKARG